MISVALALALLLRVYGLEWGLPSTSRVHSYHPDEITVIGPTLHMNIFAGEMNPHFFNYGSLFLYAVYFARLFAEGYGFLDLTHFFKAFSTGGWVGVSESVAAVTEFAKLHLLARWLSVLCGAKWLSKRKRKLNWRRVWNANAFGFSAATCQKV